MRFGWFDILGDIIVNKVIKKPTSMDCKVVLPHKRLCGWVEDSAGSLLGRGGGVPGPILPKPWW